MKLGRYRFWLVLAGVLLLFVSFSCYFVLFGSSLSRDFEKIKKGMTLDEVREIMGGKYYEVRHVNESTFLEPHEFVEVYVDGARRVIGKRYEATPWTIRINVQLDRWGLSRWFWL